MIVLACQCAYSLLQELNEHVVEGTDSILRLHIGIGAGNAGGSGDLFHSHSLGVHVGGISNGKNNRVEFFISGQVLEQVSSCEKQAQPGEAFVSGYAWSLVQSGSSGILVGSPKVSILITDTKLRREKKNPTTN